MSTAPAPITVTYARQQGKRLTYEITADRHGAYRIAINGKLLRAIYEPSNYVGKKRFGTRTQELDAIRSAEADIEQLRGMTEE